MKFELTEKVYILYAHSIQHTSWDILGVFRTYDGAHDYSERLYQEYKEKGRTPQLNHDPLSVFTSTFIKEFGIQD